MQTDLLGEFRLHEHQQRSLERLHERASAGVKRLVLQSPCGSGKTIIASALTYRARAKDHKVLILTDQRQLVYQMSDKFTRSTIPHAVLMAGEEYSWQDITIASKQTMWSRCFETGKVPIPPADLVIVDEAHKSMAHDWQKILSHYGDAYQVGMTATPEEMGGWWEEIVIGGRYRDLIPKFLVPARVWLPYQVHMGGVDIHGGEYSREQAATRHNTPTLVGATFEEWHRITGGIPRTVIFTNGVSHSIRLAEEFSSRGYMAEHVDADTPQRDTSKQKGRERIFDELREGKIQIITNVGVCRVGWDAPWVECGVLAFSTLSLVRYVQTVGRLFRNWHDKTRSTVIDHGGNVARFGWPTADHQYQLIPRDAVEERSLFERESAPERVCGKCGYAWEGSHAGPCPNCGHSVTRRGFSVRVVDGELREVKEEPQQESWRTSEQKVWDRCLGVAANVRRGNAKMAHAMYMRETGRWPPSTLWNYMPNDTTSADADMIFKKYRRGRSRRS